MKKVNFAGRPGDATAFATLLTQLGGEDPAHRPNFAGKPGDATAFATLLTQLRVDDRELVTV